MIWFKTKAMAEEKDCTWMFFPGEINPKNPSLQSDALLRRSGERWWMMMPFAAVLVAVYTTTVLTYLFVSHPPPRRGEALEAPCKWHRSLKKRITDGCASEEENNVRRIKCRHTQASCASHRRRTEIPQNCFLFLFFF